MDDSGGAKAEAVPKGREIHRVLREEGDAELDRHLGAIAWSALAAGLSMGFSFLTMATLQADLPDTPWRHLISAAGYTLGFLIVILGKQQLFTESTLTAVLPVLIEPKRLPRLLLFWAVVLVVNLIGTWLFAWAICHEWLFKPALWQALNAIGADAYKDAFLPTLIKAVLAGWLIAMTIWLLPAAGQARIWIIFLLTYVVGATQFSHIIAGSAESAFAVIAGTHGFTDYLVGFVAPTLIGNTLGGVALVAVLNHAPLATEE